LITGDLPEKRYFRNGDWTPQWQPYFVPHATFLPITSLDIRLLAVRLQGDDQLLAKITLLRLFQELPGGNFEITTVL
jgi:hypothetical protein